PELHLLAATEVTTAATPAILTGHTWVNDHPVAQTDTAATSAWTFTDHLGTPILQTSIAQGVTWRPEYEPYWAIYSLRSPDQHQPLRLPGQEAEQLSFGANGATNRTYNIGRWYAATAARYTQADPVGIRDGSTLFSYAEDNPLSVEDPLGLSAW